MRIDSPIATNANITGSFSGSFTGTGNFTGLTADSVDYANVTNKPTLISSSAQLQDDFLDTLGDGVISASAQIDHDATTNFVANEHIDHSGVTLTAGNGLTGGGTIAASRTFAVGAGDGITVNADDIQVDATVLRTTGDDILSGSAQIAADISGSLSAAAIVDLGANIVSGSASQVRTFLNVEDGADVTDSANVTSAGALMDSEVTALALIKGLTAAQISGSGNVRFEALNSATSSYALKSGASIVSASVLSSPSQGTIRLATNGVNTDVDSGLQTGDSPTFSGLTISNDVTINGNLSVEGTRTELQVATLNVEDKNILIASGAADSSAADGAGITIDGASESLTWDHGNSRFTFSDDLNVGGNITVTGTVDGRDVATDGSKLDGIEASATADQTDAEIRTAVENASDSNVFTDADHTKLNGIEASADVTDTSNVTSAGALMDSELTNLAAVKAINQSLVTTADVRFDSIGVGTAAPGTSGVIRATNDIVAFYSSDEKLKDNIEEIPNALKRVEEIRGVQFVWNDKQEVYQGADIGVIAQEVEKVAPSLVTDRDNGYKAVKYEKLTALLIQAVKELSAKVKELENK